MSGGRPKLTSEQVAEAHDLRAAGFSVHYIANHFEVTPQAIHFRLKQPRPVLEPAPERPADRWRVEHDRTPEGILSRGWLAVGPRKACLWFGTWAEALRFALTRVQPTPAHTATAHRAAEPRPSMPRLSDDLSRLHSAFPWSRALPVEELTQFAQELADPAKPAKRNINVVLDEWHAKAATYAKAGRTS